MEQPTTPENQSPETPSLSDAERERNNELFASAIRADLNIPTQESQSSPRIDYSETIQSFEDSDMEIEEEYDV